MELADAIRDALVPASNGIITRYVVIAEYVDAETSQSMMVQDRSDNLADWEAQGLLFNALHGDGEEWVADT